MKRMACCLILTMLLTGCAAPAAAGIRAENYSWELTVLHRDLAACGVAKIAMHRDLARWYNLNLLHEYEPGAREAYEQVLFFSDGVMASLELPGVGEYPIYHGTTGDRGVGHDPSSGFPLGEMGDHTVLTLRWDPGLREGDIFCVHILNETLSFQVAAVRKEADARPVPGVAYCSLVTPEGVQYLGVRTGS